MKISRISYVFLFFVLSFSFFKPTLVAQTYYQLSGSVKDKQSGDPLIGASVSIKSQKAGTYTNAQGNFSLQLLADTLTLQVSFAGYEKYQKFIRLDKNLSLSIALVEDDIKLEGVTIEGQALKDRLAQVQMSVTRLDVQTIKQLPALFGEVDVLKVLQLLPGIKSGTEGTAGFFVRGGTNDQNLVLLDGATVYNPAHMGGLFSVFNPEAVSGLEAFKGNFPAQYGGRLSSILGIEMREGDTKKFSGSGGIGLISSRLTLELPFGEVVSSSPKNSTESTIENDTILNYKKQRKKLVTERKGSILVAGRRTYFDVFTRAYNRANAGNKDFSPIPDYYFYDLNTKVRYQLNPNHRLTFTAYMGNDEIGFSDERFSFAFAWRNIVATASWNHLYSTKLVGNLTTSFSRYDYSINNQFGNISANLISKISDYAVKYDIRYLPSPKHVIRGGASYIFHSFNPNRLNAGSEDNSLNFKYDQVLEGGEVGAYLSDEWEINKKWKIDYGLRGSGYIANRANYFGLEPRAGMRYKLNDSLSFKLSYARMYQYLHLAASSTITLPTDLWIPSTEYLQPQSSDIVAIGVNWLLKPLGLFLTNEWYYKWLHNQIEYRENAQIFFNPDLDRELVFGRGWSYGGEWMLERKTGKTTGWISYTLSWSNRQFDNLNDGKPFAFRYDRRHDLSVVVTQKLSRRAALTLTFVYRTGEAITLPVNRFALTDLDGIRQVGFQRDDAGNIVGFDPGLIIPQYIERNTFRMPAYHRADLSFTWKFRPKWGESDINFSVYNLYNRANPFFLYFDEVTNEQNVPVRFVGKIIALFPILPSITYNFKF